MNYRGILIVLDHLQHTPICVGSVPCRIVSLLVHPYWRLCVLFLSDSVSSSLPELHPGGLKELHQSYWIWAPPWCLHESLCTYKSHMASAASETSHVTAERIFPVPSLSYSFTYLFCRWTKNESLKMFCAGDLPPTRNRKTTRSLVLPSLRNRMGEVTLTRIPFSTDGILCFSLH